MYFQELILTLQRFWADQGCLIVQPCNTEVGAGTFNPATFLRALGPEPWRVAFTEPSRRPADGRYGENPNRLQQFHQFQVILKPSPVDLQERYLASLQALGTDAQRHDVRFVEDDWESPTLGAWGLGWQVWLDGLEVSQYTYFQQCGGFDCRPVTGELTYGLERIAMYLQDVDDVYKVAWAPGVRYGDLLQRAEWEWSSYNFTEASVAWHRESFETCERECRRLLTLEEREVSSKKGPRTELGYRSAPMERLVLPAYDFCVKASHHFNVLDARGALSVTARQDFIKRVRALSHRTAESWLAQREHLGYPLARASVLPAAAAGG